MYSSSSSCKGLCHEDSIQVQENAEDIYAEAKQINEDRAAAEEIFEDAAEEETVEETEETTEETAEETAEE